MRTKLPLLTLMALAAAGCNNNDQGGNGPGNADGAGGRTDPPTDPAPSSQAVDPSSHTENQPGTTGNGPGETIRKPDQESPARDQ
jgi:hypothetical protein